MSKVPVVYSTPCALGRSLGRAEFASYVNGYGDSKEEETRELCTKYS